MQKFRGILRVGFEIAFRVVIFLNDKILITWAAERVPPRAAKPAGNHPDHLAEDCGCRWNGFVIRRRRACLGMPTDVGRWYECVELTKTVSC